MKPVFPSTEWLEALHNKLNSDEKYGSIASKWEGDMCVVIEPSGNLSETLYYYLDLWHGKCRRVSVLNKEDEVHAAFILTASYENIARIMKGEMDPMQAMLTRKLKVKGSMAVMMRNVPTVLDFVRCAREITSEII